MIDDIHTLVKMEGVPRSRDGLVSWQRSARSDEDVRVKSEAFLSVVGSAFFHMGLTRVRFIVPLCGPHPMPLGQVPGGLAVCGGLHHCVLRKRFSRADRELIYSLL